jgi:phage terminase large subunit
MDINDYIPRKVFLPLHTRKKRWAVVIAHRRCGKTVAMCADLVIGAMESSLPKPQFAYLAPFREQAKKVAWNYLKELTKPLQAKPPNESELKITIKTDSTTSPRFTLAAQTSQITTEACISTA